MSSHDPHYNVDTPGRRPLRLKMSSLLCCSSDMSGASNTLAREFLTDVHQLCSAVAQRAEAREEDEEESHMVALGEYLVRGRGFLLLSTLDSIIDQVRTFTLHPRAAVFTPCVYVVISSVSVFGVL